MTESNPDGAIEAVGLADALTERYLAYAMSTITSRSLPDVRDGLKPVHRRILYAMRQLRLDPKEGFKKSARVVGDVIGKYHPHGDQAIYDALVRLAQEFAARYPLVDGQGNFGNVDGDNAAAMRYTEARLTEVAVALLEGLDDDVVDFRDTYDGSDSEPVVLPARFPNLLANGASGIAVGMATSIPPHNVAELCAALIHLVETPRAPVGDLVAIVKGPDFPTGGEIVDDLDTIREAYETGRGSFRIRARWEIEKQARGTWRIVVTEMPFQVQKSRLVERIAELIEARKLPLLEGVSDESTEDIRLVLQPKNRAVDPVILMESPVPCDGPGVASRSQHERARRSRHSRSDGSGERADRIHRSPAHGPDPAVAEPPCRHRPPPGDPGRAPDRLSQSRRGHSHHRRRGRSGGGARSSLRPLGDPDGGHSQHAPALAAPA